MCVNRRSSPSSSTLSSSSSWPSSSSFLFFLLLCIRCLFFFLWIISSTYCPLCVLVSICIEDYCHLSLVICRLVSRCFLLCFSSEALLCSATSLVGWCIVLSFVSNSVLFFFNAWARGKSTTGTELLLLQRDTVKDVNGTLSWTVDR